MRKPAAFSLIELLVAVALLAVIGLLIIGITHAINLTTKTSTQMVDAAAQARLAFDRIGMDLAGVVNRPDADFAIASTNAPGTSFLTCLSTVYSANPSPLPAGFTNRGISLVAYRMDQAADNSNRVCLLRASKAIGWNSPPFMGLGTNDLPMRFSASNFPAAVLPADFDTLAPGVLRAVTGFQLYPDNQPATLADGTIVPNSVGQIVYSPPIRKGGSDVDPARISAIVVGLVVVDANTLKLLDAGTSSTLASAFSAPQAGELPLSRWMSETGNLANLPAAVPRPARQAVRLYQKFFPVTPYLPEES